MKEHLGLARHDGTALHVSSCAIEKKNRLRLNVRDDFPGFVPLALLQRKAQRTQRLCVFEGKDVYGVHQPVHWRAAITRSYHQP